ncbi:MAG: IPT/TIG domain-containing protein [Bacteroidota bacterium]
MKKIVFSSTLVLTFLVLLFSCGKDDSPTEAGPGGPNITSFSPTSGTVGTSIFITGQNFSTTASANTVKIGNTTATVTSASATEIFITVPEGATTGAISITVDGQTDTAGTFTVTEESGNAGITLNKSSLDLFTLDSETLIATTTGGANANDIVWSSEDESVAIVDDNGKITAVGKGKTLINAYISDQVSTNSLITVSPSVFAVGYEVVNGTSIAKMWKNGVASNLTDGTDFGAASSIFIDGSDIYACGIIIKGLPAAVAWKNGEILYELTDGSKYANASSIHVYNDDVYVIGNEELGDDNISNGTIWKNGVTYATLTDGLNANERSIGEDIFVNETGISSAGYEESEQHENGTPKSWENTTQIDLTNEAYHGRGYSVHAVGSEVYVAGYEKNNEGTSVAKYWINQEVISLSNGLQNAEAQSIFVDGENIYVAGSYFDDQENPVQAVVWKNGSATEYGVGSAASSVYVYDNDVYVGGAETEGIVRAIVWKNGEALELELTEGASDSAVLSIFVR